ncbi:MAG: class II fructose-bisphosphate aldolase [Epsilonproteobacteria bacterium]|nr:MAG: class II fructose-bisphosphate aldolase [Campylobacterota bacterium]
MSFSKYKGVVNATQAKEIYKKAKEKNLAIPAINIVNSESINAVLAEAKKRQMPIILQFSHGGAKHFAGSCCDNNAKTAIIGAVAGAKYIHYISKHYGVAVILHTDHANKKLLPWIDGLLEEGQKYFKHTKKPLFTSHMLDLSAELLDENIAISTQYFKKFHELNMGIEIELGITGGEEDGVDNSSIENDLLYTQPDDVLLAYRQLSLIGENFTIAASFGNVHGVYKPGNVILMPSILRDSQKHIKTKLSLSTNNPIDFVFHGGSGSEHSKIQEAISYGVVKMNIDTDTQWAFWSGVNKFQKENQDKLQTQIGNNEGKEKPNKNYYDPRVWLGYGISSMASRVGKAYDDLTLQYEK